MTTIPFLYSKYALNVECQVVVTKLINSGPRGGRVWRLRTLAKQLVELGSNITLPTYHLGHKE